MAPMAFSDQVNVSGMAGTWLGTLFTGIGLIALVSQLRSILSKLQVSDRGLQRSAGDWAVLCMKGFRDGEGLVEAVVPAFSSWAHNAYNKDLKVSLTQDDRGTGGTSGWSQLFAHCNIRPSDLIAFGGRDARVLPAVTGAAEPRAPDLADVVMDRGRMRYGFSAAEFTALLIICGFSPTAFSLKGTSCSVGFLGTMRVAEYEPFAQLARFDRHLGCRKISADLERYINPISVGRCIDYALGIVRTQMCSCHRWIIPPRGGVIGASGLTLWKVRPDKTQLNNIRFNLERLVSVSGANVLKYSVEMDDRKDSHISLMNQIIPVALSGSRKCQAALQAALLAAHALAALEPWGTLPILQQHFIRAFGPILLPFVGSRAQTTEVLQEHMLRAPKMKGLSGWRDIDEQAMALGQIGDIRTEYFSHSCSPSRNYLKAMNLIFVDANIEMHDVRIALAAEVMYAMIRTQVQMASHSVDPDAFKQQILVNMTSHLNHGMPPSQVPMWAVTVYATFLWGWLNDFIEIDDDMDGRFNRRIFLS